MLQIIQAAAEASFPWPATAASAVVGFVAGFVAGGLVHHPHARPHAPRSRRRR